MELLHAQVGLCNLCAVEDEQQGWTVQRVVAFNMKLLRIERRWTQAQTASAISGSLSVSWSVKTYSNAEGIRARRFTAEELLAVALAFDVSLVELFRQPDALPLGELRIGSTGSNAQTPGVHL